MIDNLSQFQILKDQQSDLFSRQIHRLIRFKAPSDADLQAKLKDMKKVPVLHLQTNMLTQTFDGLMMLFSCSFDRPFKIIPMSLFILRSWTLSSYGPYRRYRLP